jgi:lipopolysaccharide heptosyltransferase II
LISSVNDATRDILDWSLVQKVLLVRLRSIGDTVLMTPCLEALKSLRRDIEITVVSEPLSAPILEDHPLVDQLIVTHSSLKARARLIKNLRRSRFDVAFNMHGGTTASIIARLSGAKQAVGYDGYHHSWMLTKRAPGPDILLNRSTVHSVEQQLALLQWTGLKGPEARPRLTLKVAEQAKQLVCERLHAIGLNLLESEAKEAQSRFAIIAPAAAFEAKRWSTNRFAQVVNHLSGKWRLPSVIIAGREQEETAHKVASLSTTKPRVVTGLGLKELMALISLSSLFVGNDSGPMHIAAALNRPVVAVFGSSNPDVWHPWTEAPHRVVAAVSEGAHGKGRPDCAPLQQSAVGSEKKDRPPALEFDVETRIRKVAVEAVNAAVDEVLEEAAVADFKAVAS